ncbi:probable RNA-binding protein 19 [Uloborus diversus]|uniref:probable RNA-binding protein 19 n=1 Tax=Uloborus diversus TaxID=327109 RepID=UPI0024093565|nr:probable RNA-binding protein 19 [Uloborus diversus]
MSRIIIKNLPSTVTEKKLREVFGEKGDITDCQLKYNKAGVFRKFAFIGYKTEEAAQAAKEYFNNTFINTSRIQVEISTNLSDPNKPKSWKALLQEKTDIKKKFEAESKVQNEQKSSKIKNDIIPDELKKDAQFKEFLAVHQDRKSKPIWCDDTEEFHDIQSGSASSDEDDTAKDSSEEPVHQNTDENKSGKSKALSDVVKETKSTKVFSDLHTVKLRNLPFLCKKKEIKQFFHPLKIESLRLPPKSKGFAYVKFKTEKDMKQALIKNKGFLCGRRVDVIKYIKKQPVVDTKDSIQIKEDKEKSLEQLAETGRIYVRNLCYTVTSSEIEELFSKYGPIAEVNLPMDLYTKKAQGFAFVSYVFAEHAVKAFSELDGTVFQGRLLHLIPANLKKEYINENETNYKKKKEAKMKALSGSSHNWNILFLGMNAVADVISEKYSVEKSKLLSGDSNESVAVRMALAETQMVMETRKFLLDNGVELDAFSQAAAERSKNIIVVKHLPAKTSAEEMKELFSKYGTVARVILPPSGMVALVEFQEQSEAKSAFTKLAYSRFHHLPLYLEWAPINALKEPSVQNSEPDQTKKEISEQEQVEEAKIDDEEPPPETTIFVKNINFKTTQENFKKHFEQCGPIHYAAISMKKDVKTGNMLSMGFGFVQYKKKASATKAIQNLQLSKLDNYSLEVKFANRATIPSAATYRKRSEIKKQLTSKILVRNIPFEASEKEVKDLFKEFGTLKFVRLPKKIGSSGEHRGFGFVEYVTKNDAKRAFEALCHSTHLFGRRLVLEWANPESEDIDELRKKTAKDFIGSGGPKAKLKKSKLKEDVVLASAR